MMVPFDVLPSVAGTDLDPVPEGMLGSDCVVGVTSGVSSEESAGELSGEIAEAVGPLAALHRLTEGVFTLHAPGSCRARVWLMVIPSPAPPLLRAAQRHCGWD